MVILEAMNVMFAGNLIKLVERTMKIGAGNNSV